MMDAVEIGWLAGIIEGEGCIVIPKGGGYPSVRVAMTDEDVVRRLQQITGGGTITTRTRLKKAHHKQQWQWNLCARRDVARVLCAIAPLLGERRRARALEAAEALARPPKKTGPSPTHAHGTVAAAKRHYRNGERPCEPCRLAINSDTRARAAIRRAA